MDEIAGRPVLLVEDEKAVATHVAEMLERLGCAVVGPAAYLDDAVRLMREEVVHIALLDLKLQGQPVYPVADQCQASGVPFAFMTANPETIDDDYADRPTLVKPFDKDVLRRMLEALLAGEADK
jgi:DNA-binding response OmpR family regulator